MCNLLYNNLDNEKVGGRETQLHCIRMNKIMRKHALRSLEDQLHRWLCRNVTCEMIEEQEDN